MFLLIYVTVNINTVIL